LELAARIDRAKNPIDEYDVIPDPREELQGLLNHLEDIPPDAPSENPDHPADDEW
jgi:hypothetical protein